MLKKSVKKVDGVYNISINYRLYSILYKLYYILIEYHSICPFFFCHMYYRIVSKRDRPRHYFGQKRGFRTMVTQDDHEYFRSLRTTKNKHALI